MTNNQPIGLMDSGVGGLTILNEVAKQLPHENLIYIGDNGRAPYGVKSVETIKLYTQQMVDMLLENNIKALVIACNTITAHMLTDLQNNLSIPVIGVIDPAAKRAIALSENKQIGVIGTESTIKSNAYQQVLMELDSDIVVLPQATQSFVNIVESNEMGTEEAQQHVKETLSIMNASSIDTLILGCTHFPFLEDAIRKSFDRKINLLDASTIIPEMLEEAVESSDLEKGTISLKTTGNPELFAEIAGNFLGTDDFTVEKITWEEAD